MTEDKLTRAERTDLKAVVRMRAKVARNGIDAAKAQRLHEFERELQACYSFDDGPWAELTAQAEAQVRAADEELAKRCEALGIRPEFRPKLSVGWARAGENGLKDRRAELRRVAALELDALGKAAKQRIDAAELETVTAIVAVGMGSEALALLEAMPTVEELIPSLEVEAIEDKRQSARTLRSIGGGL